MRTLAIGDIHGCNRSLVALLNCVRLDPSDELIFLGDYVDRGPASRLVIETLLLVGRQYRCVFLRGNHEEMMLSARESVAEAKGWQMCGGLETIESYGAAYREDWAKYVPQSHWEFLDGTRRYFENGTHIFIHGCLDSELDMNQQPDWLLLWECFGRIKPHKSGKRVICGHTTQGNGTIKDLGFATCIDTGAGEGGWLTCLDVQSNRYWQANESGQTREGILASND